MTLVDSARAYAQAGYALIAVHRVGPDGATCSCQRGRGCKSAGKHPMPKDWQQGPSMSGPDIEATWDVDRPPNIGIRTGAASNLVVLDIDGKAGVEWANEQMTQRGAHWATTHRISTGSGGYHLYYRPPTDFSISNSQSKIAPGVDVRGDGGMVVAPPSISAKGSYEVLCSDEIAPIPDWIAGLVRPVEVEAPKPTTSAPAPDLDARSKSWLGSGRNHELGRLDAMKANATPDGSSYTGEPWNGTCYAVACNLIEIANTLGEDQHATWETFKERAPRDSTFTDVELAAIFKSALGKTGTQRRQVPPAPAPSDDPLEPGYVPPTVPAADQAAAGDGRPELDVSNSAIMADWLQVSMGQGLLNGMYLRGHEIVHVPKVNEEGYEKLTEAASDDDGPAQVRPLSDRGICGMVQYTHHCYTTVAGSDGEKIRKPKLFPLASAATACSVPELMYNLNPLRGVVHSTTVRPDGTLLTAAGYDHQTGLLHLPAPGLRIGEVSEHPSAEQVRAARDLISYMIADFSFVTPQDRANYIGLLLTPLLRRVAPAPYKMGLIEAHQPGSGKTYLARALMTIHGGVFRSEMPTEDAELTKTITSILDVTTGPVVVFDNASGVIRSSTLSGLLTSGKWDDRRLGSTSMISAKNDRLWMITGNNVIVSGDIARRTLRVLIDPGVPHPELRENFQIADFERWVVENRDRLLHALLTLIRNWFSQGAPEAKARRSDSYQKWGRAIEGIMNTAGFGKSVGVFDDPSSVLENAGIEDQEWHDFLQAIYSVKGTLPWRASEILALVDEGVLHVSDPLVERTHPIPYDALPTELVAKRKGHEPLSRLSKSLGWWLTNRAGRWAGDLSVRRQFTDWRGAAWTVHPYAR